MFRTDPVYFTKSGIEYPVPGICWNLLGAGWMAAGLAGGALGIQFNSIQFNLGKGYSTPDFVK